MRKTGQLTFELVSVEFNVSRASNNGFNSTLDNVQVLGLFTNGDDLTNLNFVGRNVNALAVNSDVTVVGVLDDAW